MLEEYFPVLLFLGLLCGFSMFVFWMGYKNADLDWIDAEGDEPPAPRSDASIGWFEPLERPTRLRSTAEVVNRIEERVRSENRVVAHFVEHPTVEHLHESENPIVDRLVRDIETYVHRVSALATGFAASPSEDGLHGVPATASGDEANEERRPS